jgi:hypothetical protein
MTMRRATTSFCWLFGVLIAALGFMAHPATASAFQVGVNTTGGIGFGVTETNPSRVGAAFGLQLHLRSPAPGFGGWRLQAGYDTQIDGFGITDGARALNVPYLAGALEYAFDDRLMLHVSVGAGPLLAATGGSLDNPAGAVFRSALGVDWLTDDFDMALGYQGRLAYGLQIWGFTGSGHAAALMGSVTFYVVD